MIYSCDGKVEFSVAITAEFSVTWSFRNHSKYVDMLLNKHFLLLPQLKTVVLIFVDFILFFSEFLN